MEAGADPQACNADGVSALGVAEERGSSELASHLAAAAIRRLTEAALTSAAHAVEAAQGEASVVRRQDEADVGACVVASRDAKVSLVAGLQSETDELLKRFSRRERPGAKK